MVFNMKKILEDMGWVDGYHIPVANSENLQLEAEIERLTLAKAKATIAFDSLSSKCDALQKHMKYVSTEQEENQNLLMARHSQLEAERNLYILTKMERDNLTQDIKSISKDFEKVDGRKQAKFAELNTAVAKLDKLKMSIEWDEQTIEQWENMLLKKQEDNDIIKRFSHEDKRKAKDLELKRLRLQEEELNRRQLVIRTSKELDSMELILARNIQLYKQMHEDRSALVRQWQDAIRHLQQRDRDTLAINREILSTQELNSAKLESLEQEKQFHKNEINNNKELELMIETGNAEVTKLRKDLRYCLGLIQQYTVELEAMKRELTKTAQLVQTERLKTKNLNKERLVKSKILEDVILKAQNLKVQEKNVRESHLTASERTKQLEEIIRSEEIITKGLVTDIENVQGVLFRSQKTLNDLIEISKLKNMAANGHEQGLVLLQRQKQQIDKELLLQKELRYKLDFRMAMMKSRMMRMTGDTLDDFSEEDDNKFRELEIKCRQVLELNVMLQAQINRLEDVMRNLTTSITGDTDKLIKMKDKLQDQILLVEGGIKQVEHNKNQGQQLQVEENVLKVRLKHAEKTLQQEGSTIFNLQRQQIELESMMRERESEININKDLLNVKKMALNEDKNRMKLDIQGRKIKIENFKKRLDCVVATMGKTEDGEAVSVAYFKVKNAQEKYMLQEEGDKLDNQIRKAEREIIAMENTLKAVNLTNETFKKSLSVVDERDDELAEMKQIEDDLYAQTKLLRQNRNILLAQQQKLQEIQMQVENRREKLEEMQKQVDEKQNEYDQLQNEAQFRYSKLQRADKQIKKLTSTKEIDETRARDFITRQLQDLNKSALQQLSETSVRYLETKPTINHYLAERNLSLSVSSLRSSSRSCSSLSQTSTRSGGSIPSVTLTLDLPHAQLE